MKEKRSAEVRRLAEDVLGHGVEMMSDTELLGLVLMAPGLARAVVRSSRRWPELSETELGRVPRITRTRTAQIKALVELSGRVSGRQYIHGQPIRCGEDVSMMYRTRLSSRRQEEFLVLALDNKNRVLFEHHVAKGTLVGVEVSPREVFCSLIERRAARAIALHNHPSGDPSPSPADQAVCRRLSKVGELIGIPLLDFVIVARDGSVSFRDLGLLQDLPGKT